MRYKNTDNLQTISNLLMQMKDSLGQQQVLVTDMERELEVVLSQNRRNKTTILGDNSGRTITGVRQFADYIHRSPATAMKIIKKNVLQENDVAYLVGRTWNFNLERLDQLVADNPLILRC